MKKKRIISHRFRYIGEDNPRKPSQCKGKQSHLELKVNQNEVQVLTDLKV